MKLSPATESVGIDDPITLGERQTTRRVEHGLGKVALVRGNLVQQPCKRPFAYCAVVRKDGDSAERFQISASDFKLLSGL